MHDERRRQRNDASDESSDRDKHRPTADDIDVLPGLLEKGFYVVAWLKNGDLAYRSPNTPTDLKQPQYDELEQRTFLRWRNNNREIVDFGKGERLTLKSKRKIERDIREGRPPRPIDAAELNKNRSVIIIGCPVEILEEEMQVFALNLGGIGVVVFLSAFLGGLILGAKSIRPIAAISKTAESIAEGNLSERIQHKESESELDKLSQTLNVTFGRLEDAINQQVQFTADASHELRTPLTIFVNECYWALEQKRSSKDYQESFQTYYQTAQHMRGLVESLLQLARIESGEDSLQLADIGIHLSPQKLLHLPIYEFG